MSYCFSGDESSRRELVGQRKQISGVAIGDVAVFGLWHDRCG